jgi:hypothetical protein
LDAKVAALGSQPMNLEPGLPSLEQMDSSIFIRLKTHRLRFDYEKNTKFMESVIVLWGK